MVRSHARRLRPSGSTVSLLCLLPVMHLTGALGLYSWELGNLSWDVLVHIANGCIGTLLAAAVLGDVRAAAAAGDAARDAPQQRHQGSGASSSSSAAGVAAPASEAAAPAAAAAAWRGRAVGVLQLAALLLGSSALVEVVEAAGGRLAGVAGEGVFLRGPGDFCTASLPCSEEVGAWARGWVELVSAPVSCSCDAEPEPTIHTAHNARTHTHTRRSTLPRTVLTTWLACCWGCWRSQRARPRHSRATPTATAAAPLLLPRVLAAARAPARRVAER
jgi:hypothetical protein